MLPTSPDAVRPFWLPLMQTLRCTAPLAEDALADLLRRYAETHRHYHTLTHVHALLHYLDQLQAGPEQMPDLHLAVWYHDVIYDTHAADNEERSADHARLWLARLQVRPALIEEACRLILLTRTHQVGPQDTKGQVLIDGDLAILGEASRIYDAYAHAIRQEYAWVPENRYREGRTRVLESFLGRSAIYQTQTMHATHEEPARENLRRELTSLRG